MQDFNQLNIFPLLIILIAIMVLVKIWEWVLDRGKYKDRTPKHRTRQPRQRYVVQIDSDGEEEDYASPVEEKSYDVSVYATKDSLLSPAEINFYHVLKQVVGDSAIISPKVNLWDIFFIRRGNNANFMALKAKIDRKHVDFLLCHNQTLQPLIGIELDDNSHQKASRQARDLFVDSVFEAANLPIVHIPVRHTYNVDTLTETLRVYLLKAKQTTAQNVASSAESICPKCGGNLILRAAKTGKHAGKKFWGCANYPNCKYLTAYKDLN